MAGNGRSINIHLSNRFLVKALVSYLLVALLPLSLLFWSYRTGISKSEELEMAQLDSTVERVCVAIDSDAEKLTSIYSAILSDNKVSSIGRINNPLTNKLNVWAVLDAQKQLSIIGMCGGLFDDIFIYNKNGDYIISNDSIYLKPEFLTAALAQTYRNATWIDQLLPVIRGETGYYAKWLTLSDVTHSSAALVCLQRMYTGTECTASYITMLVSPTKLESYMSKYTDICMVALDDSGNIVAGHIDYSLNTSELGTAIGAHDLYDSNGDRYMVHLRKTNFAGLNIAAILPYSAVQASVASIRITFLISALIVLLTTIALCIGFAVINTRPIDKILMMLFGVPAIKLPRKMENWQTLDASIHRLIEDNFELKRSIKLQSDYMKSNLYYELLADWQGDAADRIIPRLNALGLGIDGEFVLISMMFRLEYKSDNQTAISLTLHAFVKDAFPMSFHITEIDDQRFSVFLPASELDNLAARLDVIKERAHDMLGLTLICVFDKAAALTDIGHISWEHTRTMELITGDEAAAHSPHSDNEMWPLGVYPSKLDNLLTYAIIGGDSRQFNFALEIFWHSVLQGGEGPDKQMKLYMEHLRIAIAHAVCKCNNADPDMVLNIIRKLRYYNRLDGLKAQLEQIANCIAPIMEVTAQMAGSSLRKARITADIIDYIRENFRNADLSLGTLSEHFHLDEGYISSMIKQETGSGFQTYLESQRIEYACVLLRQNWKVKDVATAVGYNSTGNFRRAFSKVTGYSPSIYSEMGI